MERLCPPPIKMEGRLPPLPPRFSAPVHCNSYFTMHIAIFMVEWLIFTLLRAMIKCETVRKLIVDNMYLVHICSNNMNKPFKLKFSKTQHNS